MLRSPGAVLAGCLGGLSAAGVALSHGLAYFVAEPHAHDRLELLARTGHPHQWAIVAAGVGCLVGALGLFAAHWIRGAPGRGPIATPFFAIATRLAALQVLGFVGMEAAERLLSASSVAQMFSEPAVLIGLVVQIMAAALGAALIAGLSRTIERLLCRRLRIRRRETRLRQPSRSTAPRVSAITERWAPRAPPAVLSQSR